MGPIKAIGRCLKKYASPKGRARRSEFWWFFCFYILVCFLGGLAIGFAEVEYPEYESYEPYALTILPALFVLPFAGVSVRRAHDTGRSGWLLLVPVFNIVMMFLPSDPDDNNWGPSHLSEGIEGEKSTYQYQSDWGPFIVLVVACLLWLAADLHNDLKEQSRGSSDISIPTLYDY